MPFNVDVTNSDETFNCRADENLLAGMMRRSGKCIPVGCRGGGCGVCKVRVISGLCKTTKMSACHVTPEEQAEGYLLACKALPTTNIVVEIIGNIRKKVCEQRKKEAAVLHK